MTFKTGLLHASWDKVRNGVEVISLQNKYALFLFSSGRVYVGRSITGYDGIEVMPADYFSDHHQYKYHKEKTS